MRLFLDEVLRADIHDAASDGSGGLDAELEVSGGVEEVDVLLDFNGTGVDASGLSQVDQFAGGVKL